MKIGGKPINTTIINVCRFFSPECHGENKTNCGYWDRISKCPQEEMKIKRKKGIQYNV